MSSESSWSRTRYDYMSTWISYEAIFLAGIYEIGVVFLNYHADDWLANKSEDLAQ